MKDRLDPKIASWYSGWVHIVHPSDVSWADMIPVCRPALLEYLDTMPIEERKYNDP